MEERGVSQGFVHGGVRELGFHLLCWEMFGAPETIMLIALSGTIPFTTEI